MTTLLLIYFLASLFCCGLYLLGDDGMLLGKPKEYLRIRLDKYLIWKAIWDCPPCMASIWGSLFYWGWVVVWGYPLEPWIWLWIPSLFIICILNGFVWNLYCLIRAYS